MVGDPLNKTIVEQLAHIVDDRAHRRGVLALPEHLVEEVGRGEEAKHVVDARLRLVGEMHPYDDVYGSLACTEQVAQVLLIVRVVDLVEGERRLGERVERLSECVARAQLVRVQLAVLEQDADLEYDLDYVVEDVISILFR